MNDPYPDVTNIPNGVEILVCPPCRDALESGRFGAEHFAECTQRIHDHNGAIVHCDCVCGEAG